MKSGTVWHAECPTCEHGGEQVWQEEAPSHTPKACGWCLTPGEMLHWVATVVRPLGYMRQSGFSTSESDFTPHYNRAFGRKVRSLAEMKALQAQHGACDAVVKGDGADRHAPRDIQRRIRHHQDVQEKISRGEPIDAGSGVRISYTDPGD